MIHQDSSGLRHHGQVFVGQRSTQDLSALGQNWGLGMGQRDPRIFNDGILMRFNGDLMGVNGDLMGLKVHLIGFNGILMVFNRI